MGLRGILDHRNAMPVGDRQDRIHIGQPTVQMHRDDGPGARRDGALDHGRVDVEGPRIGIDQHRRCAGIADGGDRRDEGHRRGDHLIARPDAEGEQRQVQRRRARVQRDRLARPAIGGEAALEGLDARAGDIGAARQGLEHRGIEFLANARILRADIKQGS